VSDLLTKPGRFHERISFVNVVLAVVIIIASAVFMTRGRNEKLLLVIAPIWGLLWLISGIKERKKRLQKEVEIERFKSRLAGNH
jgi:hypothetical protein